MKKIGLFLDALPNTGGAFQYNLSMLEAVASLPADRFRVVIAYTSREWREFFQGRQVETVYVNYHFAARVWGIVLNLLNSPLQFWRILSPVMQKHARTLLKERCDLWLFPSQDVVSYQVPLPALVTILDLAHRVERKFPESASKFEFLLRERTFANICRWSTGVLVQTELGREQVIDAYGMPAEKIHTLPLVPPGYMYAEKLPAGFDTRYQLPAKYLFYPAQFWEHKNHKNLLKAMSTLKHDFPDLKLVLAGSKKNAYDTVVLMVQELNLSEDVQFLGYVPNEDMPELYRRARALVMPTYFGPSNIPPLEACIVGCPVAISNVSSMSEHLGDSALVFDPDSVDKIADCIRWLWTDDLLCARMAESGKQQMAKWGQREFNVRLEEIIGQVVSGRSERHP
ncbi:MAG TPA: glycosyltransferase family 1 protein [Geobacteraceae bacterium]